MPKICIVTDEFVTICGHGGIGACALGLARHLVRIGHQVDVLITNPGFHVVARQDGVAPFRVFALNEWALADESVAKPYDAISAAYAVYRFLKAREYECVHFNDWLGSGFYVAMARQQGTFHSAVVTHLHGSSEWVRSYNLQPPTLEDLEREAIERSQIENSDLVIAPSQYLLDWYRSKGVPLRRAEVVNWLLPQWMDSADLHDGLLETRAVGPGQITELIFFGRHERRKGFELFVGAIERLPSELQVDVTFIGRFDRLGGEHTGSYALRRLAKYKGRIRFFNHLGQKEAFEFIRNSSNALCVMPSVIENSPCVVGECFSAGIPFISTDVGGIAELVAPESRELALAEPHAPALAALIERTLRRGMPRLTSTLVPSAIGDRWTAMGRSLVELAPPPKPTGDAPLVSICFTHFERPALLERALRAIDLQDYDPLEIIIVDDGSPSSSTQRELDRIEAQTWSYPLRIIRTNNRYLGAARNRAAAEARGEYILFHDDDNIAEPHEIRAFVEAARTSGADFLTCAYYVFREPEHGSLSKPRQVEYFPIGIGGTFSFFRNRFGDANALVRRSTFEAIGGFSEHHGVGWEDWELFLRGYLQKYRFGVVPDPLFNYRVSSSGMLATGDPVKNAERLFEAVESLRPTVGSEVFRLAQREPLLQQIRATTWDQLGLRDHGTLHRELMALDPNSEEATSKLSDLAFAQGRIEDAIRLGLHSFGQRERLFHLVRLMQPGRAFRADLAVRQIVQPNNDADYVLLKGWIGAKKGAAAVRGLEVGRRIYDIVFSLRTSRPDVGHHLGTGTDDGALGFLILAQERQPQRGRQAFSKRGWLKAGLPFGEDYADVRIETDMPDAIAHVDSMAWCKKTTVQCDDDTIIFVDVETSEPVDVFLVSAGGRFDPGQLIHHRRLRFHVGDDGRRNGSVTVVVPNSVRADVIIGTAIPSANLPPTNFVPEAEAAAFQRPQ